MNTQREESKIYNKIFWSNNKLDWLGKGREMSQIITFFSIENGNITTEINKINRLNSFMLSISNNYCEIIQFI